MMYPQAISHGNILSFTPPGFNQELNVKFPDSRLAVCEKCKKNYKTRDMCRVRNNHTAPPWTTAYICITLDDSCTDENGKYIDKPLTVRMVQWQPFCVKKPFDPQHPVCSGCKKTNRTRSFCRERHRHRQLPWCTVYVMLSALDSTDPSTVVAAASKPLDGKEEGEASEEAGEKEEGDKEEGEKEEAEAKEDPSPAAKKAAAAAAAIASPKADEDVGVIDSAFVETDDINAIPESRTFLARVSYKGMTIHWLDLADFDPSDASVAMGFVAPDMARQNNVVDPAQAQYYAQAMGFNAQQQVAKPPQQPPYGYYQMPRGGQPQQAYAAQQQWPAQFSQQPGVAHGGAHVTAGEAAAQQQKQNQGAVEGDPNSQGQWQMVYPGQMYGYPTASQGQQQPEEGQAQHENGDADAGEEPDSKRFRSV